MARPSQLETGLLRGFQGLSEGLVRGSEAEEARKQREMLQRSLDARAEAQRQLSESQTMVPQERKASLFEAYTGRKVTPSESTYLATPGSVPLRELTEFADLAAKREALRNRAAQKPTWKPFEFGEVPRRGLSEVTSKFSDRLMGGGIENLSPEDVAEAEKLWKTYAGGEIQRYAQQPGAPRLGIRPGNLLAQGPQQAGGFFGLGQSRPGPVQLAPSPWTVEDDVAEAVRLGRAGNPAAGIPPQSDQAIKAMLDAEGWSVPLEVISAIPR